MYITCTPIPLSITQLGGQLNKAIATDYIPIQFGAPSSGILAGHSIQCDRIDITFSFRTGGLGITPKYENWVIWSKIGRPVFTTDLSNESGGRPMDWKGYVEEVFKLGNSVIVLGSNGLSRMKASGVVWGLQTFNKLGIISKGAAVSDAPACTKIFFIDSGHRLFKLEEDKEPQCLWYDEFLDVMTEPILSWDNETGNVHICDGTYGYIYNDKFGTFGEGPVNVSGIGNISGSLLVVAPEEVVTPKFHVATDIYDFGNRRNKTIQSLEIGTNLNYKLFAMIETRLNNRKEFISTPWKLVTPSGICNIPCFGTEFKIHLKSDFYEAIKIDYIRVLGILHGFTYMDTLDWKVKNYAN